MSEYWDEDKPVSGGAGGGKDDDEDDEVEIAQKSGKAVVLPGLTSNWPLGCYRSLVGLKQISLTLHFYCYDVERCPSVA
jgi:hypothetical protein